MRRISSLAVIAALAALGACSRTGTGAGVRADVTARMQSIQAPIQQCYAAALQANRKVRGMMVVNFLAASGSGQFDQVTVGRDEPADDGLRRCVIAEVSKLKLETPQRTSVSIAYPIRFQPNN